MQEVIPLVFLMIFLFFIVALVITVATGNLAVPLVMGVLFVLVLFIVGEVQKTSSKTNRRRRNCCRRERPPLNRSGRRDADRLPREVHLRRDERRPLPLARPHRKERLV